MFLFGKSFWRPLDRFYTTKMKPMKLIGKDDQKIYKLTDNIEDIVKAANKIGHPKIKTNYYDGFEKARAPHPEK